MSRTLRRLLGGSAFVCAATGALLWLQFVAGGGLWELHSTHSKASTTTMEVDIKKQYPGVGSWIPNRKSRVFVNMRTLSLLV